MSYEGNPIGAAKSGLCPYCYGEHSNVNCPRVCQHGILDGRDAGCIHCESLKEKK